MHSQKYWSQADLWTVKGSGGMDTFRLKCMSLLRAIMWPILSVCRVADSSEGEEVVVSANRADFETVIASVVDQYVYDAPLHVGDNDMLLKARTANINWASPMTIRVDVYPANRTLLALSITPGIPRMSQPHLSGMRRPGWISQDANR